MINHNNLSFPEGMAVEFYFDAETEKKIFSFRQSLYDQGITPFMGLLNDRPHISLAVFPKMDPANLLNLSEKFSKTIQCFGIRISAIGVFPGKENVFFLYPVPDQRLLDIHAEFHHLLRHEGISSSDYYLPGFWVPHCTLELNISDEDLSRMILLSKAQFQSFAGKITKLGVVAFRPIEYLAQYNLKEN